MSRQNAKLINKAETLNRAFDRAKRLEKAIKVLNADLEAVDCHVLMGSENIQHVRAVLQRMVLGQPQ